MSIEKLLGEIEILARDTRGKASSLTTKVLQLEVENKLLKEELDKLKEKCNE